MIYINNDSLYIISFFISIYFIIGLILTLFRYDELTKQMVDYIKDNSYFFASYTSDELKTLVNTSVILCVFVWPFIVTALIVYNLEKLFKFK